MGLGFAAKQAEEATDNVLAASRENGEQPTTSGALRAALSLLGRAT